MRHQPPRQLKTTGRPPLGTGWPAKDCLHRGQPMIGRAKRNNKYCDIQCASAHEHGVKVSRWLAAPNARGWSLRADGKPFASIQLPAYIRRWLIDEHGSTACWRCHFDEVNPYTRTSVVQVNHKDGNPLNNHPQNLERLCPNCHGLTELMERVRVVETPSSAWEADVIAIIRHPHKVFSWPSLAGAIQRIQAAGFYQTDPVWLGRQLPQAEYASSILVTCSIKSRGHIDSPTRRPAPVAAKVATAEAVST